MNPKWTSVQGYVRRRVFQQKYLAEKISFTFDSGHPISEVSVPFLETKARLRSFCVSDWGRREEAGQYLSSFCVPEGKNQENEHYSRPFCHPKPAKHTLFLFYTVLAKDNKNESFGEQSRAHHYTFILVCILSIK